MLWQGDWRHRLANGQYTVNVAAIDQGRDGTALGSQRPGWRGSVQTKGQFSLSSWWRFGWDVTVESDDSFRRFYQLDPILQTDRVNTVYLQGMSERNYFGAKLYQFGGLLLTDTPYSNSWVHPVIDYNYIVGAPGARRRAELHRSRPQHDAHDDGTDTNHAVAEANWRRKMIDPIGQVWTPFANARGDVYNYSDARDPDNAARPSRTTPCCGASAPPACSTPTRSWRTRRSASHVFEPTAQIIVRQNRVDQRRLPDEDAKSLVFDDTLLFDIDKFSGYDRFETGTRANIGVQYTLPGQQRALCPRRVRPELASCLARTRSPIRASTPSGVSQPVRQLLPAKRSPDEPFRLRRRLVFVAVHRREPRRTRPLRREGLDAAPPGYVLAGQLWPALGSDRPTPSRVSISTLACSTPSRR